MGLKRAFVLAVLGGLLFATLLSANLMVTADRTVLDAEYVKDTAEEEDLYAAMTGVIEEQVAGSAPEDGGGGPMGVSQAEVMSEAVTEAYVRSQVEANVDRLYAYLHGEREELYLAIDNEPLKENVVAEVEAQAAQTDLGEAGVPRGEQIEAMADSEAEFERQRAQFRERQKQRIQEATDEQLSDEELETRLDENTGRIRDRMYSRMNSKVDEQFAGDGGPPAALEEPVRRLLSARIDALTGAMTYEEYAAEVEAAKAELGAALAGEIEATLDENMGEETVLTDQLDGEATEALETARTAVSVATTLVYVLPLVALLLIGLIARVAPPSTAALQVGTTAALVGGLGVGGARVARSEVGTVLAESEMPAEVADAVAGFVRDVLGVLATQSAVLLAAGVVLIVVGIAVRRDLLPASRA